MQTYVALRFPLASLLFEAVKVACSLVEENAPRRQIAQNVGTLVVLDGLDEASFFATIDHVQRLLSDGAEVHQELHAETAGKQCLIRGFAHLEEKLDAVVPSLPRENIWVTLDHDEIEQVKPFLIVLAVGGRLELEEVV